jgi:hypothetical protein
MCDLHIVHSVSFKDIFMNHVTAQDYPGGWLGVDAIQQACASRFPALSATAPRLLSRSQPDSRSPLLLYKAWYDVLGNEPIYPAQQIGDCVSFGHGHASDLLQCVEIALEARTVGEASPLDTGQAAAEYREIDTEFIYATSREVAGILSGAEGSYGAAAVKAMTSIGLVSREMLGEQGAYSGDRAQRWGRTGAPADLKLQAASFRLGSAALVSTWDELDGALASGYPVTICTDQRFCLTRDEQGFCKPEGTLGHCMFIAGVRFDRPGACILQSWGPDVPTGPRALDQPSFSFWADRSVVEAILAQGDSWALSIAPEFVTRSLPEHWSYNTAA